MVKMKFDLTSSQVWVGLSDIYAGQTTDPSNGIFFTNGSTGGTTWVGKTCSGGTCTTVSSCGTAAANTSVVFFIKVNSTSSIDFYMDADVSNGISLTYCGNSSTNIPTGTRLGGIIMDYINSTTNYFMYVDYFRVWQDDPVINPKMAGVLSEQTVAYDSVSGADVAENYPVIDGMEIEPGTIVSTVGTYLPFIDKSRVESDKNILGVISTSPNMTIGNADDGANTDVVTSRVALSGRVPVRIDPSSQPIFAGDYITSSGNDGMGQKALKKGIVVGKALEDWTPESGKESIIMFVNLIYFDPFAYAVDTKILINNPDWYRISELNGYDDYTTVKINNSSIGSSQNLVLSIDTVGGKENINVVSNLVSGGYDISKARINTVDGIKYLEVYIGETNGNSLKVDIKDGSNWITTNIAQVTSTVSTTQEFSFRGVLFGISDTLAVQESGLKITGNLLSDSLDSNIGDTTNRWNDIYAKGTIRLGSGTGGEGAIRFNTQSRKLELSNDGITWVQLGDLSSQMVISPEYPGAILFADGTDNYGSMTSDAEQSSGSFRNYYEWVSDRETTQDYDILVRVTLPSDFVSWKEDAIYLDFMTENSVSITNNKVDIYLMGGGGIDAQVSDGISSLPGVWERMSIKGIDISDCSSAGATCTLRISVSSSLDYFVRVGDITLNYNRGL